MENPRLTYDSPERCWSIPFGPATEIKEVELLLDSEQGLLSYVRPFLEDLRRGYTDRREDLVMALGESRVDYRDGTVTGPCTHRVFDFKRTLTFPEDAPIRQNEELFLKFMHMADMTLEKVSWVPQGEGFVRAELHEASGYVIDDPTRASSGMLYLLGLFNELCSRETVIIPHSIACLHQHLRNGLLRWGLDLIVISWDWACFEAGWKYKLPKYDAERYGGPLRVLWHSKSPYVYDDYLTQDADPSQDWVYPEECYRNRYGLR